MRGVKIRIMKCPYLWKVLAGLSLSLQGSDEAGVKRLGRGECMGHEEGWAVRADHTLEKFACEGEARDGAGMKDQEKLV